MKITCRDAGFVTGEGLTDEDWGVAATDLGILWDNGRGEICVLFGDTYGTHNPEGGAGGEDWRHNVLGFSSNADLTAGLKIDRFVTDREGHACQILPDNRSPEFGQETTTIPTGACRVGDRQYMTYMSVKEWGDPGVWSTNYAGFATSDDGGETWEKSWTAWWPNTPDGGQKFQVTTLVPWHGYVYIYGTCNGRRGPAYVARVPSDRVLDLDAHEQWLGWSWGQDPDNAAPIVDGEVSELSVAWHEPSQMWLMLHLIDRERRIVVRAAPNPLGPWSPPKTVITEAQFPQLYGGFWHPWTMRTQTPCFVISQWGPYNTRLIRMDLRS